VALTRHDRYLDEDYARVAALGMGAVREAVRWPVVDIGGGRYDWSTVDRVLDALAAHGLVAIWDLCHYGLPDGCDPFSDACVERFAAYCRAVAERVVARTAAPRFFTPVNEITFFAGAGTDRGWIYPFAKGRYVELKRALCRMDIAGVRAIREVDPGARMVHVDPVINEVAPADRPDLKQGAHDRSWGQAYEAWDVLCGRQWPELGGAPEVLDVVGLNLYHHNQAEVGEDDARCIMEPDDPRRQPACDFLRFAWERYGRPMLLAETSGYQDQRAAWLHEIMDECEEAIKSGVDLQGICLYPFVDVPEWTTGCWSKLGLYELVDLESCVRVPCGEYLNELRHWQRVLARRVQGAGGTRKDSSDT
jgi:beta-glucosidase/6-phospho-beta-glucosidase/beta-galactosidase